MMPSSMLTGLLLALCLPGAVDAGFYLPGVAPKSYAMKDNVRVLVSSTVVHRGGGDYKAGRTHVF